MRTSEGVDWFDRKGNRLTDYDEIEKLLGDRNYKIIKQSYTSLHRYWVSTVWLGLNHSWTPDTDPLIFETMVFDRKHNSIEMRRWSNEDQAKVGHRVMLDNYNKRQWYLLPYRLQHNDIKWRLRRAWKALKGGE